MENRQPQRKNDDRRTTRAHGGRAPGAARAGTVSEPGKIAIRPIRLTMVDPYGNGGNMIIPDILKNVLGLKETRLRYQRLKKGGTRSQHGGLPSDPGGGPTPASAHEFLGPKWRVSWWQFGLPEGNMAPTYLPKYPNL